MGPFSKLSATFAFSLSFAPASSTIAAQSEPAIESSSVQPISVHFEIVVDTLSSARQKEVAAEVERQFAELAATHDLTKAESNVADLVIWLEFSQPDPKADVFVIHAVALYAGEVLRRDDARTCMECTSSEIAASGLKILDPAVEEVEARRAAAAAAQREAEAQTAEPPPSVDVAPEPTAPRLGVVGSIGILSSALGLGSSIAGAVLLSRGRVLTANGTMVTDYQQPGQALVGAGLGLMVVGNVLLAVDLGVLAPRRRSRSHAKLDAVTLVATVDSSGVVVSGRF